MDGIINLGDKVKVKSREWFLDNKELLMFDFEKYEPYFDKEFTIVGIEGGRYLTYPTRPMRNVFYILNGQSMVIGRGGIFRREMFDKI